MLALVVAFSVALPAVAGATQEAPAKKKFVASLVRKAHQNEEFRKALRRNPRKIIEQELGHPLPHPFKIKVLAETEDVMYIVLPWYGLEGNISELEKAMGTTIWLKTS